MSYKVFWSSPIPFGRENLRRYARADSCCPGKMGYHDAETILGEVSLALDDRGGRNSAESTLDKSDPKWPTKCEHCSYVFVDGDHWQHNIIRLYEGDGKRFILQQAAIGAMWDAHWMPDAFGVGADGVKLMVKTPGGDWHVDGRASNCTRPDDKVHKCWVRTGDPKTGNIDVGKTGDTCAAGAGSIMIGSYHGFLHNGMLT